MKALAELDWKVLLFACLGCYVLPWLVVGILVSASRPYDGVDITGWRLALLGLQAFVVPVIAMPLAAGYFTARFCANRPHLHVLLVVSLGTVALLAVHRGPMVAHAIMFVASLAIAALGAFIVLRKVPR